ncbi:TfoX/Sxy family DNA transformation protein [uncultured Litoreibacter sp.]|uniref:TfoX/Sxy family DNA transformation protein n=1 Tax=uncultured Litoreibacter sp. TaxID=1392394 RepID=UPI00260E31CA|nr:TfoX/Sxy family DNA transformation protein [uncultured Litoreibacter sp.]
MTEPVSSIRYLGPAYEASLARIGVHSADQLRALGADAAYSKLLALGDRPHFIAYYVLVMALQGRPWNDCKGAEKDALRVTFDKIKAQNAGNDTSALEQTLDQIGTGLRR